MSAPSACNGKQRFTISYSDTVKESIIECQRRAVTEGRGQECYQAFRVAFERMHFSPLVWGEPLYRLSSMRLQIRTAVVGPVSVVFAVSEDQPMVYIQSVQLLDSA